MSMLIAPSRFGASATLWTPANLATAPALWANSTSTVLDNGGGLATEWDDATGNGNNFSSPLSSTQPTITSSGQNGLRVLTFDGVDNRMAAGTSSAVALMQNIAAASIFVAGNPSIASTVKRLLTFTVNTNGNTRAGITIGAISGKVSATQRRQDSDAGVSASMTMPDSGFHVYQSEHDWIGQTVAIRMDGGTATTAATAQGSGNTSNTISDEVGLYGTRISTGQNATGSCGEVLVLQYIPTTTDRQKIEGYMAWHWGTQANLPAGHPYASAAPTT